MQIPGQAVLLRIYTDENALVGDRALIDVIVLRARQERLEHFPISVKRLSDRKML